MGTDGTLKAEVREGMKMEKITPSYKRKHTKLVTYFDTEKQPELGDITTGRILAQKKIMAKRLTTLEDKIAIYKNEL